MQDVIEKDEVINKNIVNQLKSEEEITDWLINKFHHWTDLDEIDIEQPFAEFALDSSVAVSITGELSKWCGKELPVTLLWEFPTINLLSKALSSDDIE